MRAESVPWLAAARALQCRTYLTSVSTAWPEPPQVDALRSAGVRTVNWSYGANTFCFSVANESFKDLGLLRSVSVAAEVWVWNEGVERWLRARSLGPPPSIRLIGPVMSGDARWLARTPHAARAAYGLPESPERRYVAVFDVPPVTREVRLAIGHGPSVYAQAMLEQFFKDIEGLLRHQEIVLMLKPKRALNDAHRNFADSMQRILSSLLQNPENSGTPANASIPTAYTRNVTGIADRRPPIFRMSCSP
jgi:polysaccharide biosynthesis PFTS motif protein